MPPLDIIQTAADVLKLRSVLSATRKLIEYFKKKRVILIVGASGVGKTQFRESLLHLIPNIIDHTDRTTAANKRLVKLAEESVLMIDTPGQEGSSAQLKRTIAEWQHRCDLVINVCANGYHENQTQAQHTVTTKTTAKEQYLKQCRLAEIEHVEIWLNALSQAVKKPRLLTLVTKADIWWDDQQAVRNYYEKGAYRDALGSAAETMAAPVIFYAAVRKMFYNKVPISGSFDDREFEKLRTGFINALAPLLDQ